MRFGPPRNVTENLTEERLFRLVPGLALNPPRNGCWVPAIGVNAEFQVAIPTVERANLVTALDLDKILSLIRIVFPKDGRAAL